MKRPTQILCGIILITIPTIEYGGYFLLSVISGKEETLSLTTFQNAMFRAGHGHAGVLVILSLVALILSDHARLTSFWLWVVRIGFPTSAILVSGGFFAGAIGEGLDQPNTFILVLYIGMGLLALCLFTLGLGMVRKRNT